MRLTKSGKPDKRYKAPGEGLLAPSSEMVDDIAEVDAAFREMERGEDLIIDSNELHDQLLKDNGLQLDFDVLEGTVSTQYGIIKLEKPTLIIKASYVK